MESAAVGTFGNVALDYILCLSQLGVKATRPRMILNTQRIIRALVQLKPKIWWES